MLMYLKLAIRNVFRNQRRSLLVSLSIGIGMASLFLIDGFWEGMIINMKSNITDSFIGHGQIQSRQFKETQDPVYILKDPAIIIEKIEQNKQVIAYTKRVQAIAMLSSSEENLNVIMVGINPSTEKAISLIDDRIIKGSYLNKPNEILIGNRAAERLNVRIGDHIVITTSQINGGGMAQELLEVAGIYYLGAKELDEGSAFLSLATAQRLLAMGENINQLVLRFKSIDQVHSNDPFWQKVSNREVLGESWQDLAPSITSVIKMSTLSKSILTIIIFTLVALGILNSMFMSIYERIFEFGVLRALGTPKHNVVLLIALEAAVLAVLSIAIGFVLALGVATYWHTYGVDYGGIELGEMTFREPIYFVFCARQFYLYPLLVGIFTVFISLYPGIKAAQITITKAMEKTL